MGIFDLFKNKPKPSNIIATYTLASHYKGFKAFPMVVYGNDEAMKNNKALNSTDLAGKTISFQKESNYVKVIIDNLWVGTIFDSEQIESLKDVSAVYARNDIETVIGKKTTEKRARIHLFVKHGG